MKKNFVRAALAAALLCGTAGTAAMVASTAAFAADEPHVSRDVGKPLKEAIEAAQGKDFATAKAKIAEAQAVTDKTPFDEYKINEILGYVSINTNDFVTAAQAYEAMADSPAMPADAAKSTLHNALLLASQQKHWDKVIAYGTRLDPLGGMDAKADAVVAQAYYFGNDLANANIWAQKAVDAAKAAGQDPEEGSLQILMSVQAKNNNQAGAVQTLEQIAVLYGTPDNWAQLIDVALGTGGIRELDALFLYRLRFLAGATSASDDYTDAAGMALHMGYPAEAESILEKGMGAGTVGRGGKAAGQLASARSGARADEASLKAIASAAANAKSGEQAVKLAEDYWGYGRYADAAAAATSGIAKGGVKDPGEAQFILGISLVAQGKYDEGRAALAKVDGSPARAKAAHLWDLYAQSKSRPAAAAAPAQH